MWEVISSDIAIEFRNYLTTSGRLLPTKVKLIFRRLLLKFLLIFYWTRDLHFLSEVEHEGVIDPYCSSYPDSCQMDEHCSPSVGLTKKNATTGRETFSTACQDL
jgi:hypothetical protein